MQQVALSAKETNDAHTDMIHGHKELGTFVSFIGVEKSIFGRRPPLASGSDEISF